MLEKVHKKKSLQVADLSDRDLVGVLGVKWIDRRTVRNEFIKRAGRRRRR